MRRIIAVMWPKISLPINSNEELLAIIQQNFDFTVSNIIAELDLRKPIYAQTSCYGHFGRPQFTWERIIDLKL